MENSYEKAKREWEQSPNETDPTKTNKEYFKEENKKMYDEVFKKVKERSDKKFKEKKNTFYTCSDCGEKVCEDNRIGHELHHTLHPSVQEQAKREFSKLVPMILFWGSLILLVWWLMARNDNTPDLNVPDNGQQEEVCPNGYPC